MTSAKTKHPRFHRQRIQKRRIKQSSQVDLTIYACACGKRSHLPFSWARPPRLLSVLLLQLAQSIANRTPSMQEERKPQGSEFNSGLLNFCVQSANILLPKSSTQRALRECMEWVPHWHAVVVSPVGAPCIPSLHLLMSSESSHLCSNSAQALALEPLTSSH